MLTVLTFLVSATLTLLPVALGASGAWSLASPLPWGRSDLTATVIGPHVYLAGGCDGAQKCSNGLCICSSYTNDFTTFTPSTNKYTTRAPMPRPRYRHLACPMGDDAILMMGGRTITDDPATTDAVMTIMDHFNATTGNWTTLTTAYPTAVLGSDNSCSNFGTTVYVFGGYNRDYTVSYASTYSFTITPGTKGLEGVFKALTPMPMGIGDFSSVAFPATLPPLAPAPPSIHVYGGYTANLVPADDWYCKPLTVHFVYTPSTNTWTTAAPMPFPLAEKDDGVVVGGKIFSVGGESKRIAKGCSDTDIVALREVWSWDPAKPGEWGNETWLPSSVMRFASAPFPMPTTSASGAPTTTTFLYVFGGQKDLINGDTLPLSSVVYVYNPSPTPTPAPASPSGSSAASSSPTFTPEILAMGIVVTFVLTCLLGLVLYRTGLLGCRRGGPSKAFLSSGGGGTNSSHSELESNA
jgi:hypothetical protein